MSKLFRTASVRRAVAPVVVATSLLFSAVALAAVVPAAGTFRGGTNQHRPISFAISQTRRSINRENLAISFVCPDGHADYFVYSTTTKMAIHHGVFDGSFKGMSRLGGTYLIHFSGHFVNKKRVSGQLQLTITYPTHGACSSGAVYWSARHR